MQTHHPLAGALASHASSSPDKFGRLFPDLPPFDFDDDAAFAYANALESVEVDDNPETPAAYTYFGQFVDHDVTFDPFPGAIAHRPGPVANYRTPRFDLDCVYGAGPLANPYLYDRAEAGRLLIGRGRDHRVRPSTPTLEDDLPRNAQGIALVGDPRNDQNVMVSQIQLAFLRLHNQLFRHYRRGGSTWDAAFEQARKVLQWHYQWVVLHDFLKRLVGQSMIDEVLPGGAEPARNRFRGQYIRLDQAPVIPLEFSGAAYRIGHTMVRNAYVLSNNFEARLGPRVIFHPAGEGEPRPDLRGSRFLPWAWSLQWDRFLKFPGGPEPQRSQRIDCKMALSLRAVPGFDPPDLALRNLLRGRSYGLPSGQDVAQRMGIAPLESSRPEPLWFYILREAAETQDGLRLGSVGARIVAEVFLGILAADEAAFVNAEPSWRPWPSLHAPDSGAFELKDLIYASGLPCSRQEWVNWVEGKSAQVIELGPSPDDLLPGKGPISVASIALSRGAAIEMRGTHGAV